MNRFVFLLIMFFVLLVSLHPAAAQDDRTGLFNQINVLRANQGLFPYQMNDALNAAATAHSQWMAATGVITHDEDNGSSPESRAIAYGYGGKWVHENIFAGVNATPQDAMNFWINSPIHYAGLTHTQKTDVGIGIARDSLGTVFYTVMFGEGSAGGAPPSVPQAENPVPEVQEAPAESQNGEQPTQPPPLPTRPPITWTPSPTVPTLTPTVTWTPTFTWTPSATATVPPPSETPIILEAAAALTTPTPRTISLSLLPKGTEIAHNTTPSPEPTQTVKVTVHQDTGLGWRVFLLPLILVQGLGIGWVLWRLGSHRKRL